MDDHSPAGADPSALEADVLERVKEQRCLYAVLAHLQRHGGERESLLAGIPALLPPGWQFPEVACARVRCRDLAFATPGFRETPWGLSAPIALGEEAVGSVEVRYLEERPERDEGPFLREERALLEAIARALGEALMRREKEARFGELIERAPVPLCYVNAAGEFAYFNQRFERLFGYTQDDVPTLERWWQLAYPDGGYRSWVIETWTGAVEEAAASGEDIHPVEYRVTCKDGSVRLVEISGVVMGDAFLASFLDVTERRRQERQLRAFLENTQDLVTVVDAEGRFLHVNRAAEAVFGLAPAEAVGRLAFEFVHPDERAGTEAAFAGWILARTTHAKWQNRQVSRAGEVRHMDWVIMPRYEADGSLESVWSLGRDITDLKKAEAALRANQRQLEARARIAETFATAADEEVYGQALAAVLAALDSRHGVIGYLAEGGALVCPSLTRSVWDECDVAEKDIRFPAELMRRLPHWRRALYGGELVCDNRPVLVPEGHIAIDRLLIAPIRGDSTTIGGLAVANSDRDYDEEDGAVLEAIASAMAPILQARLVLEREQARRAAAEADLRRSNQDLEQFAYVASHDLQEPLRMVSSYTQLLGRRYGGQLDERADKYIRYAVDGAARMQVLIQDLLRFSRVTTRGGDFAPVDLGEALSRALQNLEAAIEESGAEVTAEELPVVVADGAQMVQLLQNLVGNAIKFRGEAPPRVHVGAREEALHWVLTVRDNGIGFDAKYADKVFVIFQRLHTRTEYPGSGIGLALCKRIVERHGGTIAADPEPGKGTTFHITLAKRGESDS